MIQIFPLEFMDLMASEPFFTSFLPATLINLLHSRSLGCFIIYLYLLGLALMKKTNYNGLLFAKACKRKISWSWPVNLNMHQRCNFSCCVTGQKETKIWIFEDLRIINIAALCHLHMGRRKDTGFRDDRSTTGPQFTGDLLHWVWITWKGEDICSSFLEN